MEDKKKRRGGRPKGRKTQPTTVVDVIPGQCPKCGSTASLVVEGRRPIVRGGGVTAAGVAYDRSTWRRVRCVDCGQHYTTRTLETNAISFSGKEN